MTNLKFFWNGIKGNDGKLQRCFYSNGALLNHPAGTMTIYSKEYSHFTKDIQEAFEVENKSDSMSDYFEKDYIRVMQLMQAHNAKRHQKYLERSAA